MLLNFLYYLKITKKLYTIITKLSLNIDNQKALHGQL